MPRSRHLQLSTLQPLRIVDFCARTWYHFCHGHAVPSRKCPVPFRPSRRQDCLQVSLQARMESLLWHGPRWHGTEFVLWKTRRFSCPGLQPAWFVLLFL